MKTIITTMKSKRTAMPISREPSIKRVMKELGMPRAVAEEFIDEIDDYIRHWTAQLVAHSRRHRRQNRSWLRNSSGHHHDL